MAPPRIHSSSARVWLLRGARVLAAGGEDAAVQDVLFRDGRVAAVGARLETPPGAEVVDASGRVLAPGWIDIQVNDLEWLAGGQRTEAEQVARARVVARRQAEHGVTGLVLATVAAPLDALEGYLRGIRAAIDRPLSPTDHSLLGAHVEGTFMNPALSGAHNRAYIFPPDLAVLERLLSTGAVRILNVAPEMSPGALEVIARATARGVTVGVGHARPHAERVREAIRAGLRFAIHLGNGPTGSSWKVFWDGGLLEEALRNDALVVSLILDGVHLHPAIARDWIERKGYDHIVLTSDAAFALDLPGGEFEALGLRGRVSPDRKHLEVLPPAGTPAPNPLSSEVSALFGSAANQRDVFENALNLLSREVPGVFLRKHGALPTPRALEAASLLCSGSAARLLGLADRGVLVPGARADALLLELRGPPGSQQVRVEAVWIGEADGRHRPASPAVPVRSPRPAF